MGMADVLWKKRILQRQNHNKSDINIKEISFDFLLKHIPDVNILFNHIRVYYRYDNINTTYYRVWFGTNQGIYMVWYINGHIKIKDFSFIKIFNEIDFIKWKNNLSINEYNKLFKKAKKIFSSDWRDIKYVDTSKNITLDDSETFDISEFGEIPNYQIVYVITFKSSKQYVGRSKNGRSRLFTHINDHDMNTILNIKIFRVKEYGDAIWLERKLINDINPELNITLKVNGIKQISFNKTSFKKDVTTCVASTNNVIDIDFKKYYDEFMIKANDIETFDASEFRKIPNYQGVYIMTFKSGQQYIGKSKKLKKRLNQHIYNHDINTILNIKTFKIKKHDDVVKLEKKLINDVNPELNTHLKPNIIKQVASSQESQTDDDWPQCIEKFMIKVND